MKASWQKNLDKFFILVFTFLAGYWMISRSENFKTPVDPVATHSGIARDPAAIKRTYDFSHLEGSALSYASKQRLLEGIKIINDKEDVGIGLGHFVFKGPGSEKVFACEQFSKVILVFEGEGMAVGGELPKMEVEGPCSMAADINAISPIWIPTSQFLKDKPFDGEYDFKEGHVSRLKFTNIADAWPKTWVLRSVQLKGDSDSLPEVTVVGRELETILEKPLIINF